MCRPHKNDSVLPQDIIQPVATHSRGEEVYYSITPLIVLHFIALQRCYVPLQIEGKTLYQQTDYNSVYCGGLELTCNISEVCLDSQRSDMSNYKYNIACSGLKAFSCHSSSQQIFI